MALSSLLLDVAPLRTSPAAPSGSQPRGSPRPAGLVSAQACFSAVSGPAARTFVPRLLAPGQIAAGLALNRVTGQAALLLGPAAGGAVLAWLGPAGCYLIDAASFGAALYAALRLPGAPRAGDDAGLGHVGRRDRRARPRARAPGGTRAAGGRRCGRHRRGRLTQHRRRLATPDALLGRVSAAELVIGQAGPSLGSLWAGLAATRLSAPAVLAGAGALSAAAVAGIGTRCHLRSSAPISVEEPQVR